MTTWPAMCDDFLKDNDFGKYIKNSEKEGKKILPTLDIASKTPLEQVEAITKYVKEKYNWNGNYGKLSEYSVSDFIDVYKRQDQYQAPQPSAHISYKHHGLRHVLLSL